MAGETELAVLLASMRPSLDPELYVFISRLDAAEFDGVRPMATVVEDEGVTAVIRQADADAHGWRYEFVAQRITLRVHSALAAVGLTAAVATVLAEAGIAANVIAAYYHDHVYVPADRAEAAINALTVLTGTR